ncbi:hypothetical protein A9Q84_01395 [Halobacteriovorax marinus]|uniref:Response regulatory domain-containing protein n=1 Tax=Halobacteriovorax marinus TaxID=97084 RepID=A0A1Y5FG29_9BACT|nr:hypothetical protein A9Q84_01395 [Halobacteriovorax marinus]
MKNLLYVEDENDLQSIFKNEVIKGTFNVYSADDAPSAIELITEVPFDIIIFDLFYVGKGSAKDILKVIEGTKKKIESEIFILSGYATELEKILGEYSHILDPRNSFLKPEGFFELITRLEKYS